MDINVLANEMDAMVSRGEIVDAVKKFFADDARTSDFSTYKTENKTQMIEKMEGFTGSIARVNGITLHNTITGDDVSASEFTFDFNMKDGSTILWHEIIRRKWRDGKVIHEEYFNS